AGFHAHDPFGRQAAGANQEFGVFARVDVVGDDSDVQRKAEALAQGVAERGLARADRAADADPDCGHDRTTRSNWPAGRIPAMSSHGANEPAWSSEMLRDRSAAAETAGLSRSSRSCTVDWPMRPSRRAADSWPRTDCHAYTFRPSASGSDQCRSMAPK